MKVLIIEDEPIAAERLQMLLKTYDAHIEIIKKIGSIEEAVLWLSTNIHPDILFLDIQLSDGYSFEIFRHVTYHKPIVFTTAYNEYALDAFKYYALDYLVKPVTFVALQQALDKFKMINNSEPQNTAEAIKNIKNFTPEQYKERFLIKTGQKFVFIKTTDVAYFKAEDKLVFLIDKKQCRYLIDYTLEKLESILNPKVFFRLNRRVIISIESIEQVKSYTNNRLQLHLPNNYTADELIVSRERVADFRQWAEQ